MRTATAQSTHPHDVTRSLWLDRPITMTMLAAPGGQIAQSVEQGIENPRVGGSIPSLATQRSPDCSDAVGAFFVLSVDLRWSGTPLIATNDVAKPRRNVLEAPTDASGIAVVSEHPVGAEPID